MKDYLFPFYLIIIFLLFLLQVVVMCPLIRGCRIPAVAAEESWPAAPRMVATASKFGRRLVSRQSEATEGAAAPAAAAVPPSKNNARTRRMSRTAEPKRY